MRCRTHPASTERRNRCRRSNRKSRNPEPEPATHRAARRYRQPPISCRLPRQPRGWYREYTVDTPGLSHRGARRIVTGGNPPREWYYTDDHYDSFRGFDVAGRMQ